MKILPKLVFLLSMHLSIFGSVRATYNDNAARKRPHIVLIIADDMGWNDVSFNGADQIPTPNIDALAYNGVILNRHYVLPTCTPSRTSLMTGRYAIREGMQGWPLRAGEPRGIPLSSTLMPEYFRRLGYSTHLVGKWHLGYTTKDHTPASRGFDTFFGYYNGLITYFEYWIKYKLNSTTERNAYDLHRDDPNNLRVAYNSEYFTDLITDEAERVIMNNGKERPLFLEISHLAVHASENEDPLEVRNMSEVNATYPYIGDLNRRKYAGMMKAMDESVGRVVTALSTAKMLDNSVIVFMSDNGAPTIGFYGNSGSNYPFRGIKNTILEGGVRGAACIFSPLIKAKSRVSLDLMHISDWLPTLYSAAGGNLDELQQPIDGVNQWPTIVYGGETNRTSVLLNIDRTDLLLSHDCRTHGEGAILGRFKLTKGAQDVTAFLGESGNDQDYPSYNISNVLSSQAALAIATLQGFYDLHLPVKAGALRRQSTVNCNKPRIVPSCSTCLFDLQNDPCETEDLSQAFPTVFIQLEGLIDSYKKVSIPAKNTAVDWCADPLYFNNIHMPWRISDEDLTRVSFNSSNVCNRPNYEFVP